MPKPKSLLCSGCFRRFEFAADQAGQVVNCPFCGGLNRLSEAWSYKSKAATVPEVSGEARKPGDQVDSTAPVHEWHDGMLRVACPDCGYAFQAPQELAGRRTNCPRCQEDVHLPHPQEAWPGHEEDEDDLDGSTDTRPAPTSAVLDVPGSEQPLSVRRIADADQDAELEPDDDDSRGEKPSDATGSTRRFKARPREQAVTYYLDQLRERPDSFKQGFLSIQEDLRRIERLIRLYPEVSLRIGLVAAAVAGLAALWGILKLTGLL
jgi:DNA-directed RNA polymerase subunit RPC12/RpoP